jgi:DNA repair exonuclease SbcCD nuclease subunit
MANFERALQPALDGEVDLVVHGGDLFYRSKVPAALVEMAMDPLVRVAEAGVPVYLVPGNHERSRIPLHLWTGHPNLHIFHQPTTFLCQLPELSIALAGFPFARKIGGRFAELVDQTGYRSIEADLRLLCLHQTVEGSQVGPGDFTFRAGPEVIRGADISGDFQAVLAGHIHRSQLLTQELGGRPLAAAVIYSGSVERTSFAERHEDKHYALVNITFHPGLGRPNVQVTFVPLPARPMVLAVIDAGGLNDQALAKKIRGALSGLDPNAVVRVRLTDLSPERQIGISAATLRSLAPPTMNVSLAYDRSLNHISTTKGGG